MRVLTPLFFLLAALIKLAPIVGAISASRLEGLYGIPFDEPNLLILMRHRAVLLGLVGALLLGAAFVAKIRTVALAIGLVSALSFHFMVLRIGGYNDAIARVALADVVVVAALVGAGIGHLVESRRASA